MSDQIEPTPAQIDYRQRLLRVLVHIQKHLDTNLPLEDLAAVAHFSPFHFHRVFTAMMGETLAQHIRRLRLERAALRLQHTTQPITTIAFDCGYENHESFTRVQGGVQYAAIDLPHRNPQDASHRRTHRDALQRGRRCAARIHTRPM